jgi:predicted nucleic acid-binding protein
VYSPPTPIAKAVDQVDAWLESPALELLGENSTHWEALKAAVLSGKVAGPLVHDARVAAMCASHGVRELWTADRDFSRFTGVTIRNPLV